MIEYGWIYLLIELLLYLPIFYFGKVAEEDIILCWTGIRRLTDLLASTAPVIKIILVHVHRHLTINALAFYSAKTAALDDSLV